MRQKQETTKAASLTGLAAFAIWVGAAVWMILTTQPGRVWWAWGISVILVLILIAVVNRITQPSETSRPDSSEVILDSANSTLDDATKFRPDSINRVMDRLTKENQ